MASSGFDLTKRSETGYREAGDQMLFPGDAVQIANTKEIPEYARGRVGRVAQVLPRRDGTSDIAVQILYRTVVVPEVSVTSNIVH